MTGGHSGYLPRAAILDDEQPSARNPRSAGAGPMERMATPGSFADVSASVAPRRRQRRLPTHNYVRLADRGGLAFPASDDFARLNRGNRPAQRNMRRIRPVAARLRPARQRLIACAQALSA